MSNSRENDSPMAPEWVSKNFKFLKYEHIIYHFKARDLEIPFKFFREIFKFRENTRIFKYFAKVIAYSKSPDYVLFKAIYNMFIY